MKKKIGIIYNEDITGSFELASEIKEKLDNSCVFSISSMPSDIDFAMVIGGDGTFLKSARFYSKFRLQYGKTRLSCPSKTQ